MCLYSALCQVISNYESYFVYDTLCRDIAHKLNLLVFIKSMPNKQQTRLCARKREKPELI